jgi:hypothetical protein
MMKKIIILFIVLFSGYMVNAQGDLRTKRSAKGVPLNFQLMQLILTAASAWQTEIVILADYAGESTVYIAFHYSDDGDWGYGWAVDNIVIEDRNEHDFMAVKITPPYVLSGTTVSPKVVIKNTGTSTETSWTVVLTDSASYTSTVAGTQSIATDETYTVIMDDWTPSANSTLTATVTLTGDEDNTDNQITKNVLIFTDYEDLTYAGSAMSKEYGTVNMTAGAFTAIGDYSTDIFPAGEDYDGNYIYRVLNDFTIGIVYPNCEFEALGTLSGVEGAITGIAYDWNNDMWYANLMYTSDGGDTYYGRLCTINMDNFTLTLVGQGSNAVFMRGVDFANDGFLYGPSLMSQQLIKIDPATGENYIVGDIGLNLGYAQDVSFDGVEQKLYSITCSSSEARFGYYGLNTGAFTTVYNYGSNQFSTIVVTKEPLPAYEVIFNVTDGTNPVEGATVTIGEIVLTTDESGEASIYFIDGAYNCSVEKYGYQTASNNFTVNGNTETVNIVLTASLSYTVTFNISNNISAPLNADVAVYYEGSTVYSGTAVNGTISFNDVPSTNYTYDVIYDSYISKIGEPLTVDDGEIVNVVLEENIIVPFNLNVAVTDNSALFSWMVSRSEVEISYYIEPTDYEDISAAYQNFNEGYGVVYDLTNYSYALIHAVDFHHASWDTYGTWNYKIHVINMTDGVSVYTTNTLQTTGNDIWETGISLGDIDGLAGKQVGIFLEALSGTDGDAYPCLSSDNAGIASNSYKELSLTLVRRHLNLKYPYYQ